MAEVRSLGPAERETLPTAGIVRVTGTFRVALLALLQIVTTCCISLLSLRDSSRRKSVSSEKTGKKSLQARSFHVPSMWKTDCQTILVYIILNGWVVTTSLYAVCVRPVGLQCSVEEFWLWLE